MKKLISILTVAVVTMTILLCPFDSVALTTSEANIPSETSTTENITISPDKRVITSDKKELKTLMSKSKAKMKAAKRMEKAGYELDYNEGHPIIEAAQAEWRYANDDYNFYKKIYDNLAWLDKAKKYPTASKIWKRLQDAGYNDYVCAGILGNIMAEVGGQTLNIQSKTSDGYYGICQWSIIYFPGVVGKDVNGQCDFLLKNIEKAFNSWGHLYGSGFDYDEFCGLQSATAAARAFAVCYERCASFSYSQREKNAIVAYEYFTG